MKLLFLFFCTISSYIAIISASATSYKAKQDIYLIKEIVLSKIFGSQTENKSKPIFVQENIFKSPEGLLTVGKEEINIKIPKETEEPFKPEYSYKQIRNDGSAIVYSINNKDELLVSDTKNQPNSQDSTEQRNKPAFSSFQARLKPSKPCKTQPQAQPQPQPQPYVPFNPERPIMFSMPQAIPKIPDYLYKLVNKDGSVTTYFGPGEVQELRDSPLAVVPNSPSFILNRIQSSIAGAPYLPSRRNLFFREDVDPIELIEAENQLPVLALPRGDPSILQNELVYLQPSYNVPVRLKPNMRIDYAPINTARPAQELEDIYVSTNQTKVSWTNDNSSETIASISELVSKLAATNLEFDVKNITGPDTKNVSVGNFTFTEIVSPYKKHVKSYISTTEISASERDNTVDVSGIKSNSNSLDGDRGDVPNVPIK